MRNKNSIIDNLHSKGLIKPPNFILGATQYEVLMGSVAYGVNVDTSDMDIYGFAIPPKNYIFPHLSGYIDGFEQRPNKFEQFQKHHIIDKGANKEYDINIYNIVKYFKLVMDNNPNMIDSLFVPQNYVLHSTKIGDMIRNNRWKFLHKGAHYKFKGYAFSQMRKMKIKTPDENSKRFESVKKYGYDIKFAYHLVRLLNESEQILLEHDLDLQKNNDMLIAIRSGLWSLKEVEQYFYDKEKILDIAYHNSTLRATPDIKFIKQLLIDCLEEYYGSLENAVIDDNKLKNILSQITNIVDNNRKLLL